MIDGNRVRQVRELLGWTQTELGRRLSISQPAVARIEGGDLPPSQHVYDALVLQTGFPPSFFQISDMVVFPRGSLLFRSQAAQTVAEEANAYHEGWLACHIAMSLEKKLQLLPSMRPIPLRVPRHAHDPVAAAQLTRSTWSLAPNTPIPHLVRLAEKNGILVLAIPGVQKHWDAYSNWVDTCGMRPIIITRTDTAPDRLRLSMGHEIGHIVMHQSPTEEMAVLERQAYTFARELLLPEDAMRQELTAPVTLTLLAKLKVRWKVAIQVLMRRALDLKAITKYQYEMLNRQIQRLGWRENEPQMEAIPYERPRGLRQMAEMIYGNPIDFDRLASDVSVPASRLRVLLDAYAAKPARTGTADENEVTRLPSKLLHFTNGSD